MVAGNFLLDSESRMRSAGQAAQDAKPPMRATTRPIAQDAKPSRSHKVTLTAEVRDTVCGMTLKAGGDVFQEKYNGKTFSFCSDSCVKDFQANTVKYAGKKNEARDMAKADRHHD